MCFPGTTGDDVEAQNDAPQSSNPTQDPSPRFQWTEALQQNFREELEKLVILDYMMRNTGIPNVEVCLSRSRVGQLDD
jgi:phosphatidylinositol 4-kinase type 2